MNLSTIYPRQATEPLTSPTVLSRCHVTTFTKWRPRFRQTEEARRATLRAIDALPAYLPTFEKASNNTAAISEDTMNLVIDKMRQHLTCLRLGGTPKDWAEVFGMVRAMIGIDHIGAAVRIDRAVIIRAWDAMLSIQERHLDYETEKWKPGPLVLTGPEITALDDAIDHNQAQLMCLNRQEFITAVELSVAWSTEHLQKVVEQWRERLN